jgi:hypothetical protein
VASTLDTVRGGSSLPSQFSIRFLVEGVYTQQEQQEQQEHINVSLPREGGGGGGVSVYEAHRFAFAVEAVEAVGADHGVLVVQAPFKAPQMDAPV